MNCKNCFSASNKSLFSKEGFTIYKCLSCGLVFSDKSYSSVQAQGLYPVSYYANLKNFSPITDQRYYSILRYLEKYSNDKRILDFGSGTGQFLLAAEKTGWETSGIEISIEICEWVKRNFGLHMRCGEFLDMDLGKEYFDAVTMFESLEHLDSPNDYLAKINYILKERGILFLTTPNLSSLSRRILGRKWEVFSREHLCYFRPVVIRDVLLKNGFRVIKSETRNFSLLEVKNAFFAVGKTGKLTFEREEFRAQIENSRKLNFLKKIINTGLDLFGLGDSIWIFAQKIQNLS